MLEKHYKLSTTLLSNVYTLFVKSIFYNKTKLKFAITLRNVPERLEF